MANLTEIESIIPFMDIKGNITKLTLNLKEGTKLRMADIIPLIGPGEGKRLTDESAEKVVGEKVPEVYVNGIRFTPWAVPEVIAAPEESKEESDRKLL